MSACGASSRNSCIENVVLHSWDVGNADMIIFSGRQEEQSAHKDHEFWTFT